MYFPSTLRFLRASNWEDAGTNRFCSAGGGTVSNFHRFPNAFLDKNSGQKLGQKFGQLKHTVLTPKTLTASNGRPKAKSTCFLSCWRARGGVRRWVRPDSVVHARADLSVPSNVHYAPDRRRLTHSARSGHISRWTSLPPSILVWRLCATWDSTFGVSARLATLRGTIHRVCTPPPSRREFVQGERSHMRLGTFLSCGAPCSLSINAPTRRSDNATQLHKRALAKFPL